MSEGKAHHSSAGLGKSPRRVLGVQGKFGVTAGMRKWGGISSAGVGVVYVRQNNMLVAE